MSILGRGIYGEPVRRLQEVLGVEADGIFGAGTEAALRDYQSNNGLAVDGLAGPDTFSQMGLHELILLKQGTHGETVKKLQAALGIDADGAFGPGTAAAVRSFQDSNGLHADGIAGPKTLALVDGFAEITEEKVEASLVAESYEGVSPDAVAAAATTETPAHESVIAKIEDKVVEVGKSIWNTVKSIF